MKSSSQKVESGEFVSLWLGGIEEFNGFQIPILLIKEIR